MGVKYTFQRIVHHKHSGETYVNRFSKRDITREDFKQAKLKAKANRTAKVTRDKIIVPAPSIRKSDTRSSICFEVWRKEPKKQRRIKNLK